MTKDWPSYLDLPRGSKPPTNADRIRGMSDEELAAFLEGLVILAIGDYSMRDNQRRLDWLQQPAETEGTE